MGEKIALHSAFVRGGFVGWFCGALCDFVVRFCGAVLWGDFVVLCAIFADGTAKSTRKIKPCER